MSDRNERDDGLTYDDVSVSSTQAQEYLNRAAPLAICWSCGHQDWRLLAEGDSATLSTLHQAKRSGMSFETHTPFVTFECACCHTLWTVSAKGIREVVLTRGEDTPGVVEPEKAANRPSDEITAVMCALDGMSAVLTELVDGADARIDRIAYSCADHLKRLSDSLERALPAVKQMEVQP